jgi:hypothetical protein
VPRARRCAFCQASTALPFYRYAEARWRCLRAYGARGRKVNELVACPQHGVQFEGALREFRDEIEDSQKGIPPAKCWGHLAGDP